MENFKEKFSAVIKYLKNSGIESPNKPIIPHLLRVGEFLFNNGFSDDVVTAGLLHDSLEWSEASKEEIENTFGQHVLAIAAANTKDRSIQDPTKRRVDTIKRCQEAGEDALVVKAADVIDNFNYYSEIGNAKEVERCREYAVLLKKVLPENLHQLFFPLLQKIAK